MHGPSQALVTLSGDGSSLISLCSLFPVKCHLQGPNLEVSFLAHLNALLFLLFSRPCISALSHMLSFCISI